METILAIAFWIGVIWLSLKLLGWLFKVMMKIFGFIGAFIAAAIPMAITYFITYSMFGVGMTKLTVMGVISTLVLGGLGSRTE